MELDAASDGGANGVMDSDGELDRVLDNALDAACAMEPDGALDAACAMEPDGALDAACAMEPDGMWGSNGAS